MVPSNRFGDCNSKENSKVKQRTFRAALPANRSGADFTLIKLTLRPQSSNRHSPAHEVICFHRCVFFMLHYTHTFLNKHDHPKFQLNPTATVDSLVCSQNSILYFFINPWSHRDANTHTMASTSSVYVSFLVSFPILLFPPSRWCGRHVPNLASKVGFEIQLPTKSNQWSEVKRRESWQLQLNHSSTTNTIRFDNIHHTMSVWKRATRIRAGYGWGISITRHAIEWSRIFSCSRFISFPQLITFQPQDIQPTSPHFIDSRQQLQYDRITV